LSNDTLTPGWTISKVAKLAVHESGVVLRFTQTIKGWQVVVDNTGCKAGYTAMNEERALAEAQAMLENHLI
jgi:hypothetical protein